MGNISDALRRAKEESRRRQAEQGVAPVGRPEAASTPAIPLVESKRSASDSVGGGSRGQGTTSLAVRPTTGLDDSALALGGYPDAGLATSSPVSLSALLRYKWTVILVSVLVTAVSVPWIWVLTVPKYRASAAIRVSPVVPRILFKTDDEGGGARYYQSYLNTQVSVIRSPRVLQRVLDLPEVQKTAWYTEKPGPLQPGPSTALERLRKDLTVSPRRGTELIDVAILAKNAKESALIVNATVSQYQQLVGEKYKETDGMRFEALSAERTTLRNEIEGLINTKFSMWKERGAGSAEEVRAELSKELNLLEAELGHVGRQRENAQWLLKGLESDDAGDKTQRDGETGVAQAKPDYRYADDAEWKQLRDDLDEAQESVKLASQRFGDSHYELVALRSRVDLLTKRLRQREQLLEGRWLAGVPGSALGRGAPVTEAVTLKREIGRLKHLEGNLAKEIEQQHKELRRAGDAAQELAHYDEQIARKRELLEQVQSRLEQLEMEGRAPGRITVANKAFPTSRPHQDRRILLTLMVIAGAMTAGVVVAFLRSGLNPTIFEPIDVTETVRAPFLGQFPKIRHLGDPRIVELPESIRIIRTALLERLRRNCGNSLLVTSSGPQAGKTTLSILLARSLAQLGKKVLLVDADFSRSTLSRHFQIDREAGLISLLAGVVRDEDAIVESGVDGLHVLPVGRPLNGHDPDLLANGRHRAALERWKEEYDIVMVDGPPMLYMADARILAGQTDGIVMALRASHCRRTQVLEAFEDLSAAGGLLLGTILVGSNKRPDYGKYGYYYQRASHKTSETVTS